MRAQNGDQAKGSVTTKHAGKSKRVLPFNSQSIDAAGPIDGKQTEYRIEGERGLVLVVTPEGTGTYFFRYTIGHGKARKFRSEKIGRRDETTLHDARDKAGELRLAVGRGADPVAEGDARRERGHVPRACSKNAWRATTPRRNARWKTISRTLEADVFHGDR